MQTFLQSSSLSWMSSGLPRMPTALSQQSLDASILDLKILYYKILSRGLKPSCLVAFISQTVNTRWSFLCCPPDSDWGCCKDPSQDLEDMLCNTLLITGPTGVGKTSAVYACAQELGFKVSSATAVFPNMHPLPTEISCRSLWTNKMFFQNVVCHKMSDLILLPVGV